jgi:hypothetical protein
VKEGKEGEGKVFSSLTLEKPRRPGDISLGHTTS